MSFHNGWLPREGFTADIIGKGIRNTLLNPTLTLPLYILGRYTDRGVNLAIENPKLFSWTKWLAALGVVRVLNGYFNRQAVNHGVKDVYDWPNEIVLVTGGSDGIGKSIVLMLATKKIKTVVLDIQPLTYEPPPGVSFYKCDITSTESIGKVAQEIQSNVGQPTVLINNAGVCRGKPLLENTDADLNLTFDVNAIAHYKLARVFVPSMIKRNHGMIVTVASTAAWVTAPRMTEYASSKAAALAFHEGLAAELVTVHDAPKVRTVVVNQGYTRTSLFQGFATESPFLVPALHVDSVAQAIVDQVLKGESGQIILPGFLKLLGAHFRSLPDWWQYPTRVRMQTLMTNWNGRQVPTNN